MNKGLKISIYVLHSFRTWLTCLQRKMNHSKKTDDSFFTRAIQLNEVFVLRN